MTRLRTLTFLCLFVPILANAQWFRTRENATTQRTIFYRYWPGQLTSSLPTYWDFPDTGKTWILYNDTIIMPRFIDKNNNPAGTTFLSINSNGWVTGTSKTDLLSSSVKYTDTSVMLSKYVRALDTTGRWAFKANYLLSETDPVSVHSSDSASMLSPYIRAAQASVLYYPATNPTGFITSAAIAGKLNASDTTNKWAFKASYLLAEVDPLAVKKTDSASMLSPYIRALNASQTYYPLVGNPTSFLTAASITGKVNVSDTASMLSPYAKLFQLALKTNLSDTASMLSPYVKSFQLATKVNISDTATMLTNYQRKAGTRRVETYIGTTDGSGNYTVTYGTAFATTPDVQPQLQTSTTQQQVRITASSTTGFTVNATNRSTVTLLSVDVLLGATAPLTGVQVGVLVTSR